MNLTTTLRKIRGCEGEVAAQVVLEYAINAAVEAERERCEEVANKMRVALAYVLEDDGLLPRATSATRKVCRDALAAT